MYIKQHIIEPANILSSSPQSTSIQSIPNFNPPVKPIIVIFPSNFPKMKTSTDILYRKKLLEILIPPQKKKTIAIFYKQVERIWE
jgi:hypothetical protein